MEEVRFRLEEFEGPLDLLLGLISKNKMNIYDVNIVELIDQYLAIIGTIDAQHMDSASEFITMASYLVEKKTIFLLPRSEESERAREELTGMLVEYSLCKQVAAQLKEMAANVYIAVREPVELPADTTYQRTHEAQELRTAYLSIAGKHTRKRQPQQEQFEPIVQAPFVSVTARIIHVLRGVTTGRVNRLRQLFAKGASRSATVATFLAVLELMRAGRLTIGSDDLLEVHKGARTRLRQTEE